ncbi:MAG: gamma-glutamyltransferase [Pseudomonadota bacterium]
MRFLTAISLCLAAACGQVDGDEEAAQEEASTSAAPAGDGEWFIAAANPYAVEAGAEILRKGGSAVDAAVATLSVLGLVEPQSSGLGGGAFMLHYDPAGRTLISYDGRETAPASATPDRFLMDDGEPMKFYDAVAGGLSVGVPGVVRMLEVAHQDYGVLPWNELFEPAIALSERGFSVSPRLNGLLARFPRLKKTPEAADYFYGADGEPRPVGYVLKNPDYAQTLQTIRDGGADAFYTGAIADAIVEAVNNAPNPGGMTLEDLKTYTPVKREPVCGFYRTYQICSMAPPSSGGVTTLQILSMLEPFDLRAAGAGSIEALHLITEASKLAYADRRQYLADNDMAAASGGLTQDQVIAGLMNPPYLAARASLINTQQAASDVVHGDPSQYQTTQGSGRWRNLAADASPEPPSTTHFTIVDAAGRVVSMTATVEFAFGSHQMAAGFILNNQLTDFSFLPERDGVPVANAVAPGKRPRSSMAPAIVFDKNGDVWAALGSPGGPAIIGYVVKTLIAMMDWGLETQEAIDYPNIVAPRGGVILETDGFDSQIIAGLTNLGHDVNTRDLTSGVHAFRLTPDGDYDGGADKRREGTFLTGTVGDK